MGKKIRYGLCQCGCGEKTSIAKQSISSRNVVNGEPRRFMPWHSARVINSGKDLRGIKFGLLTVLSKSHSDDGIYWNCVCECGRAKIGKTGNLLSGGLISCGCMRWRSKHGKTDHRLFSVWCDMVRRCRDKNRDDYKNYGGRGITICDRWKENFNNFLEDMGERPEHGTLERINTNGNYEKGNCKWASRAEQNRNSRNSKRWHIGDMVFDSASLAGEYFGVCHTTIINWCKSEMKSYCYSTPLYV